MRFLPGKTQLSIAIVGFGYVGSCIGITLAERGMRVSGIDTDRELIEEMTAGSCRFNEPGLAQALQRVRSSGALTLSTGYEDVSMADVVIIAVGTPVDASHSIVTAPLGAC